MSRFGEKLENKKIVDITAILDIYAPNNRTSKNIK